MATEAWKGFIRSWHKLGIVLLWMIKVIVGIPFAIATCLLIAACVLVFGILCLLAACGAIFFVGYCFMHFFETLVWIIKFIKDRKAARLTLPLAIKQPHSKTMKSFSKEIRIGKDPMLKLQAWGTAPNANQEDENDPPGYIYPWFENPDLQEPTEVHLTPTKDNPLASPRPLPDLMQLADPSLPDAIPSISKKSDRVDSLQVLLASQYQTTPLTGSHDDVCRLCNNFPKMPDQFPTRPITKRCKHHPEVCLDCLASCIEKGLKSVVSCPLCGLRLKVADVKEFAAPGLFLSYLVDKGVDNSSPAKSSNTSSVASSRDMPFNPVCRVCNCRPPLSSFPTRPITTHCTHHPEICFTCLSNSIMNDFYGSTWQRICCPLCNLRLQYQDVKAFAPPEIFKGYFPIFDTSVSGLPDTRPETPNPRKDKSSS